MTSFLSSDAATPRLRGTGPGRWSRTVWACLLGSLLVATAPAHGQGAGAVAITASPAEITYALEADPPPGARIQVSISGPGAADVRLIRLVASPGVISAARRTATGWEADYTPPDLENPTVALIRAELERGGRREVAWVSVPIAVREVMNLKAPPGSSVLVRLGNREFGPAKAPQGQATLSVDVPPGATSYTLVISPPGGEARISHQPIKRPAFARIALAGPDQAVAGDTVAIDAFVVDATGRPFASDIAPLRGSAPGAVVVRQEGTRSAQRLHLRLPEQSGAVRVKVALTQETGVEAEVEVKVGRARRVTLELELDPPRLQVGTSQAAMVTVRARDAEGVALDPDGLAVTVAGRPLAVDRVTEGEFRGFVYAPGGQNVTERIEIRARASRTTEVRRVLRIDGGPATELRLKVPDARVLADGRNGVTFEVVARDRFGLPAAERELRVDVENGTLDYLHRIRAGLFRGRFVPHRATEAGRAAISVRTTAVRPVSGEVRLLPVSQRWFLVPTVGMLSNLGSMMGPQAGLRLELAVFRRRPLVVLGLEAQLAYVTSAIGADLPEEKAWGVSGGVIFSTRVRPVSAGRFGLDLVVDLGVLGVHARSHIRRSGDFVDPVSDTHGAFTASLGLDAAILTRDQGEVVLYARIRYLTASYDDGSADQSAAFLAGIGYRFAL